jgi:hypothetical protein
VEEVYAALREAGMALCLAESEDLETPQVITADFSYLRLRKPSYSAKAVTVRARELVRSGDVYVYLKHEDTPEGAVTAEAVLKALKK